MKFLYKKRIHLILVILVSLDLLSLPVKVNASFQQVSDCTNLPLMSWREQVMGDFTLLFPDGFDEIINNINRLKNSLGDEYVKFTKLYNASLSLPINIRIYPNVGSFYCLNVITPTVAANDTHSHIGIREIALFGDRILNNLDQWQNESLNILRYELGVLITENITNSKAPPGLLAGVGMYMMDPNIIFEQHSITISGIGDPSTTWRSLWEDDANIILPEKRIEAVSIVAFLIDTYGWPSFLQLLNDLRTSEGYRRSLMTVYGTDISTLQSEWEKYYPLYYQGRWQAHILYNFDLSAYQQMIAGGAYTDALLQLNNVIPFLEQINQSDELVQAQALLGRAKSGQEASALVVQARQALLNRQYEISIQLSDQAQAIFAQLGDTRRINELNGYRDRAMEVLSLDNTINLLLQEYHPENGDSATLNEMIQISQRLAELGEPQMREALVNIIQDQKEESIAARERFFITLSLITVVLLAVRIYMIHFKPHRERI